MATHERVGCHGWEHDKNMTKTVNIIFGASGIQIVSEDKAKRQGAQGLEAQLLREVVAQERGELEEAKERLLLSLAADTRQLQDLQDRILKLLKVTPPSVSLILNRENSKTLEDFDYFFFLNFRRRLRSWVVKRCLAHGPDSAQQFAYTDMLLLAC